MLLRFDPFRELERLADQVATPSTSPAIPMDAIQLGDRVEIRFDLPGVDPTTVDLEIDRNVLTVKAERRWTPTEGQQVLARERRHGSFARQVFLGDTLDGSRVEANYVDGVLTVSIPVAEAAKPRKIEIGQSAATSDPPAIDTTEAATEPAAVDDASSAAA